MMKQLLSSIGIGAAKVDTILTDTHFRPGEKIHASVHVTGGEVAQQIECIYFYVAGRCLFEEDNDHRYRDVIFSRYKLTEPFTVQPSESKEISAHFTLDIDTPISTHNNQMWVQTGLDIPMAIDPKDKDPIIIVPNKREERLFDTMEELGFFLQKSDCKYTPYTFGEKQRILQEFEFKPNQAPFYRRLDEVELVLYPAEDAVLVTLKIDYHKRGLGRVVDEVLDLDETRHSLVIEEADLPTLKEKIENMLEEKIEKHAEKINL